MTGIMGHFKQFPTLVLTVKKLHKLHDIIFITIAAVICGADDWNDIEGVWRS